MAAGSSFEVAEAELIAREHQPPVAAHLSAATGLQAKATDVGASLDRVPERFLESSPHPIRTPGNRNQNDRKGEGDDDENRQDERDNAE